jgi:hypothetical protein
MHKPLLAMSLTFSCGGDDRQFGGVRVTIIASMDALNWGVCESLGKKVAYFGWYTWTCTYTCIEALWRTVMVRLDVKTPDAEGCRIWFMI